MRFGLVFALNAVLGATAVAAPDSLADRAGGDGPPLDIDAAVQAIAKQNAAAAEWLASPARFAHDAAPAWLTDPACEWRLANPLLLHAARASAIAERHEDVVGWLDTRRANNNRPADPQPDDGQATALYYSAIANHQLVRLKAAGEAAEALLALPPSQAAQRHRRIAAMVLADSRAVKEESLGYVSRLMADSRRRLTLGRSGKAEQQLQEGIIERLDKEINKLEAEQQKQQQQAGDQKPGIGADPMRQSLPAEMKGAGDVDDRRTPNGGDWGSLPPAEREKVTQQIIRDFPGHYRTLIEEYFRSLADPQERQRAEEAAGR